MHSLKVVLMPRSRTGADKKEKAHRLHRESEGIVGRLKAWDDGTLSEKRAPALFTQPMYGGR